MLSEKAYPSTEETPDDDELVYVPFEFQGDGRKREARRHKAKTVVPQDEINLDKLIRDY